MKINNLISILQAILYRNRSCKILLYHRVADVKDDPHLLSVSIHNFKDQMVWLKKNFDIIPLSKLVKQIKHHTISSKSACITFDDGYADNFYNALPILKQFQVPATIFVTSSMVDKKTPFYWDINTNKKDQGRSLNKRELVKLAKDPLIEIGSHTITHPRLANLSMIEQQKEIKESKVKLENVIKRKIKSFSFPFGTRRDFNKKTIKLVKSAGYSYACASFSNNISNFSSQYMLPRIIVRNWPLEVFIQKINN